MSTITAESMDGLFSVQAPSRLRKAATPALRVFEGHDRHEGHAEDDPAEAALVKRVRRGEETAFNELVERYHSPLRRVALTFVHSEAVAEEVVQDTWIAALEGIHRFEGRSSLKTWIFRILVNRAKTQGVRESRYVEFPGKASDAEQGGIDMVDELPVTPGGEGWPGNYSGIISSQTEASPERKLLNKEMVERIYAVIHTLPAMQCQVILLRDVEGLGSEDVCRMLSVSESNQRVLLHRARTKVRQALAPYMDEPKPNALRPPALKSCA
ncbi:RNA polymerase sigma factor [Nitrospira sp. T9]|uniref:RNA polymerase sigma factor n=1 Tax=unclassified Nitrospira TaxID=2652172 RepID=UPI003F98BE53